MGGVKDIVCRLTPHIRWIHCTQTGFRVIRRMLCNSSYVSKEASVKKWVLSAILAFATLAVVFWAISPLLITYAQAIPPDISFDVGNRLSIEAAIVQTQSSTIEYFREIYGDSVLAVSTLALFNAVVAIFCIFQGGSQIAVTT